MDTLIKNFTAKYCKQSVPDVRTGYLVCVHQKIKEGNKERIQKFQGTVIKTNSASGISKSFTVRKISEGIGVEKTFLLHSPNLVKVDVLRAHKVRRSKLYFLRALSGKALRLREVPLKLRELVTETPTKEDKSAGKDPAVEAKTENATVDAQKEASQNEGTSESTQEKKTEEKA